MAGILLLTLAAWLAAAMPAAARSGVVLGFGGAAPLVPPHGDGRAVPWGQAAPRGAAAPSRMPPPSPPVTYVVPPPSYAYPSYGYVPPPGPATPLAQACRAGTLSCAAGQQARPGDACSCPTPRGPAWGRVGG